MTRRILAIAAAALPALLLAGGAVRGAESAPAKPAAAGFERFKSLAGEWVAAEDGPMVKKGDLVARYHVTGGGSAVVEELFPGTEHQMTTVYFTDEKDIVLTHYCMVGNQPHMRAKGTEGSRIDFAFDGGTNLDPKKDVHMHTASFEFLGADELRSTWNEYDKGKPTKSVVIHVVRKTA